MPGPSPAVLAPRRRDRRPSAEPAWSRAATHPARRAGNSAGRSKAPRRGCGAAVRGFRGGRRWAAREPSRVQKVAVRVAAPLGEVSAGGARLARPGARCRAAPAARGTRRWQPAAGGVRSDSEPRAAAPPRTPPSARRERKRGARTPPRDPGRSARPRAPRLGPQGEVGAWLPVARRERERAARWADRTDSARSGPG